MNTRLHFSMGCVALIALLLVGCSNDVQSQHAEPYDPPREITESGGVLQPEQAAYNVSFYDINLEITPETESIEGYVDVHATYVHPNEWMVLDLDTMLTVESMELITDGTASPLSVERRGGQLWAQFPATRQPGHEVQVRVTYAGAPRVAPNPPWQGGFTWASTADGQPWIATSNQGDGPDLWWPVKDHPSDKADSVAITVTVPEPLEVASNGVLRGVDENGDGTRTFRWFTGSPISNYNVALNIAPYDIIEEEFESITGETFPFIFWVLPENRAQAEERLPQFREHMAWFEETFGPYPFRDEKYGIAHTPHLGMEHQTIIAYGSTFSDEPYGYDWLHHHELAHEWWANLVTALDWRDFWIHEGFGTYAQALYLEDIQGAEGYQREIRRYLNSISNVMPVAPREPQTTDEIYFLNVRTGQSNSDIYYKGALVLHTLRYLLGDEVFFESLRRFAYPTPEHEATTGGEQVRFATTDDYLTVVEELSGEDLDWFFEVYVRQPELPRVVSEERDGELHLRWETPVDAPFPMPIAVSVNGESQRVEMEGGEATVSIPAGADVDIDPENWVLRQR